MGGAWPAWRHVCVGGVCAEPVRPPQAQEGPTLTPFPPWELPRVGSGPSPVFTPLSTQCRVAPRPLSMGFRQSAPRGGEIRGAAASNTLTLPIFLPFPSLLPPAESLLPLPSPSLPLSLSHRRPSVSLSGQWVVASAFLIELHRGGAWATALPLGKDQPVPRMWQEDPRTPPCTQLFPVS